jgi:hypothetical protein
MIRRGDDDVEGYANWNADGLREIGVKLSVVSERIVNSGVKIWKKGVYLEQIATRNVFHELCYYYNFIFVVKTLLRNNNFYYKKNRKKM